MIPLLSHEIFFVPRSIFSNQKPSYVSPVDVEDARRRKRLSFPKVMQFRPAGVSTA